MTPTEQDKELDEILQQNIQFTLLGEFPNAVPDHNNWVNVMGRVYSFAFTEAKQALLDWHNKQMKDPFDYIEPCEPDCSKERHAYHQGQWDMAHRMADLGLTSKEVSDE